MCVAKFGNVNSVHGIYAIMKEFKHEPNAVTYNTLMKMHVALKSTDMVLKLKKEMDENKIEPNVNTSKVLITMYCDMGNWKDAYEVCREMIEEKCLKPSLQVYEMVLQQLKKAGQLKEAQRIGKNDGR